MIRKVMGYFDEKHNVDDYIKMVNGVDGRDLIYVLKKYLAEGSTVLELGMGPGKDLDILRELYKATGSDNSQIFVDMYKQNTEHADIILLDAVTLKTERKFACVYSNKVLHHLTKKELKKSFANQKKLLNDSGILFHSFWYGDKSEEYNGLLFTYYTEKELKSIIEKDYQLLEIKRYKEMEDDDSFYIVLRIK